jgi:hypothetical protein
MEPIPPHTDPREFFPKHKERGKLKLIFTVEDIAEAARVALSTARSSVRLRDLTLEKVALYLVKRWAGLSRRLTPNEVAVRFSDARESLMWERRWPQFELWWCGVPGCEEVLLAPGLCEKHGGGASLTFNTLGYICVGKIPLHRMIADCPSRLDVHHKDGNRWNNHPTNLEGLSHDEHWAVHKANPGGLKIE